METTGKLEMIIYMRCWPGGVTPARTPGAILQIAHPGQQSQVGEIFNAQLLSRVRIAEE